MGAAKKERICKTMKIFKPAGFAASIVMITAFAISPASARNVKCLIETPGETFQDICNFESAPGGSFTLSPSPVAGYFFSTLLSVSVGIYGPGRADVRGLTREGINSRWGEASRSTRDGACWAGADFRICAW